MENYSITINKELAQRAFDFGKKLGLLDNEKLEEVFPEKVIKEREHYAKLCVKDWINASQSNLENYLMYLNSYSIGSLEQFLKAAELNILFYKEAERKVVSLREMVLGEHIIEIAKKKDLARDIFVSPKSNRLFTALSDLLKNTTISHIEDQFESTTNERTVKFAVNGKQYSMVVDPMEPYLITEFINEVVKNEIKTKRLVIFEGIFLSFSHLGYGAMLANKDSLKFEDNKFIPFFYKENFKVIGKEPITEEDKARIEKIAKSDFPTDSLKPILEQLQS